MFSHWLRGAGNQAFGLLNVGVVIWMFHHLIRIYLGGPFFPHVRADYWFVEVPLNIFVIEVSFLSAGHRRNLQEFCFWVLKFALAITAIFLGVDLGRVRLWSSDLVTLLVGLLAFCFLQNHYRAQPPNPTYERPAAAVPSIPTGFSLRRRRRWL